jgi:hypothetical protein
MHLEETVKLTMFAAGLRSDDLALAAGADWVAEQVVAGQREFDLDAIQDAVSNRGLRAGPTRTIVSAGITGPSWSTRRPASPWTCCAIARRTHSPSG